MRRADPKIEIGDISIAGGELAFMVRNPTQVDTAVDLVRNLTNGIGVTGQRDWQVAVRDSIRIVIRLRDVKLALAGEPNDSPVATLIQSGALDLSKPGNLVKFIPKKPPAVAAASSRSAAAHESWMVSQWSFAEERTHGPPARSVFSKL